MGIVPLSLKAAIRGNPESGLPNATALPSRPARIEFAAVVVPQCTIHFSFRPESIRQTML
jgi:hypothetical protein